jgi:hypothetical protein
MNTEPNFNTKNHYKNSKRRLQSEGWTLLNEGPFTDKCIDCLVKPACVQRCQQKLLYDCIKDHGLSVKETAEVYYKWDEDEADINIHILNSFYSILINNVFGWLHGTLNLRHIFAKNEKEIQEQSKKGN